MFDAPPPNLPVEPATQSAVPPLPPMAGNAPMRPGNVPPPAASVPQRGEGGVSVSGTKEPEDIFSDIQEPLAAVPAKSLPQTAMTPPKHSSMKMLIAIGVPIAVIGLGIGVYFLYQMYMAEKLPVPQTPQAQVPPVSVSITTEPVGEAPVDNPIPPPDEKQLAATQASMAMLQAQAEQQLREAQMMQEQAAAADQIAETTTTGESFLTVGEEAAEDEIMPGEAPTGEAMTGEADAAPVAPPGIEPTSIAPPAMGPDTDGDGLTNSEEVLLGSDPNAADSDGDTYEDGSELAGGYDPAQPRATIEQSLAMKTEVIGSVRFLIPSTWTRTAGPGGSVRIQTGTPASFAVNQEMFASTLSLPDWLISQYPGSVSADYQPGTNIYGADVVYSKDQMTAWLLFGNTVYSIRYATNGTGTRDFGALFDLMISRAQTAQ